MTRSSGTGWSVARCVAFLLVPTAFVTAPVTAALAWTAVAERAAPAPVPAIGTQAHGQLERLQQHPVLRTLGIPRLGTRSLMPVFKTGFERDADLAGFYVTPQSPMTRHQVQRGNAHRGQRAHVAWLTGETGPEPVDGPNHRGYPTIQLQRTASGPCATPCLIQFWARVDGVSLNRGEWLSLATLSPDGSDRWSRVITVNIGWEGWLHLFHVPDQGIAQRAFQRTDVPFPRGAWVRITIWLDLDPAHGAAAVWQNGLLMSASRVRGGDGTLDQMHFGLYAPPSVTNGIVRNDDITVSRVGRGCRRISAKEQLRPHPQGHAGAPGCVRSP